MSTQLEASVTINSTDYSDEVSEFVIEPTRTTVTQMATYADASENDAAGVRKDSVTITCKNEQAAASLARELYTAILTDSAELAFVVRYDDAAIGVDNPEYSGNLIVTAVTLGTKVGDERIMSQTFPVNSLAQATS